MPAGLVNGTPNKRLFWSIISDYDLQTGVSELVDNAIDMWLSKKSQKSLRVKVELNIEQQIISVRDNAGGVGAEHLDLLVAPGGSTNDPLASVVGVFGVGSKRAGVALGEHVQIRTRHGKSQTMAIEVDKDWLISPSWDLPKYEVPNIGIGTTEIEISKLRRPISEDDVDALRKHLSETYGSFISERCAIELNSVPVNPITFDHWAYPQGFEPQRLVFDADYGTDGALSFDITGGLIIDRDPETENYGVYFYCNDRLIAKELKVRDVGYFVTSEAGVPHPDASLCRVIVRLNGAARSMPWTSNKAGINYNHGVFRALRPKLIQLVSYFSKLSRRTKADWAGQVFSHVEGQINERDVDEALSRAKLSLPPLPKGNRSHIDLLKKKNLRRIKEAPWTLGLVEAVAAIDVLSRQRFDTGNRIALVLLDSNFEIGLKEFIVHEESLFPKQIYKDSKIADLFSRRYKVVYEIKEKVPGIEPYVDKVNHYYEMRNKLIHERATLGVTDNDIREYTEVIEKILMILFKLRFSV